MDADRGRVLGRLLPFRVADTTFIDTESEAFVSYQIHSTVPMRGKRATTVRAPMTAAVGHLKILLAGQEELLPDAELVDAPSRLVLSVDAVSGFDCLDNDASMHSLGFDFPPLLRVSGFGYEVFATVRASGARWPVAWWPHMSVTDLVRQLHATIRPADLRCMRVAVTKRPPPPPPPPVALLSAPEAGGAVGYGESRGYEELNPAATGSVIAGSDRSSVDPAESNKPCVLPIAKSFAYSVGIELHEHMTVQQFRMARGAARAAAVRSLFDVLESSGYNLERELRLDVEPLTSAQATANAAPVTLEFLRTQESRPVRFAVNVLQEQAPNVTLGEVKQAVLLFCATNGAVQALRDTAEGDALLMEASQKRAASAARPTDTSAATTTTSGARVAVRLRLDEAAAEAQRVLGAADASERYPDAPLRDPFGGLTDPFDDDDEEVAPQNTKRLYCHDDNLLVKMSEERKTLAHDLRFAREPQEAVARLAEVLPRLREAPLTLSFQPPANQKAEVQRPTFIDTWQDFRIHHLSDLGVFPGAELVVDFFDPHTRRWSPEVAEDVHSVTRRHHASDTQRTASVAVRTVRGTIRHFNVIPDVTTAEQLLRLHFCTTGDLPMYHLLAGDGGKLFQLHEPVVRHKVTDRGGILPRPTLYAVHRPRLWFGEGPDVDLSGTGLLGQPDSNPVAGNVGHL